MNKLPPHRYRRAGDPLSPSSWQDLKNRRTRLLRAICAVGTWLAITRLVHYYLLAYAVEVASGGDRQTLVYLIYAMCGATLDFALLGSMVAAVKQAAELFFRFRRI